MAVIIRANNDDDHASNSHLESAIFMIIWCLLIISSFSMVIFICGRCKRKKPEKPEPPKVQPVVITSTQEGSSAFTDTDSPPHDPGRSMGNVSTSSILRRDQKLSHRKRRNPCIDFGDAVSSGDPDYDTIGPNIADPFTNRSIQTSGRTASGRPILKAIRTQRGLLKEAPIERDRSVNGRATKNYTLRLKDVLSGQKSMDNLCKPKSQMVSIKQPVIDAAGKSQRVESKKSFLIVKKQTLVKKKG